VPPCNTCFVRPTRARNPNGMSIDSAVLGRPFVKRFTLCCRTVVCQSVCLSCPVCNVCILWPSGWTDQNETSHAGRPRPWPHCWMGTYAPSPKEAQPQFSAHVYCANGRPSQLLLSTATAEHLLHRLRQTVPILHIGTNFPKIALPVVRSGLPSNT